MPSYGWAIATRVRGLLCTALVVALPLGVLSFFISHYSLQHDGAQASRALQYIPLNADATPSAGSCIIGPRAYPSYRPMTENMLDRYHMKHVTCMATDTGSACRSPTDEEFWLSTLRRQAVQTMHEAAARDRDRILYLFTHLRRTAGTTLEDKVRRHPTG
jgi:hypothetical protein